MTADAASTLLAARRDGRRIARLPEDCRPRDPAAGYALQSRIAASRGAIGGWKIGAGAPDDTPLYAKIPARDIYPDGVALSLADFPGAVVETEIAFRLRVDLPPRVAAYDLAEVSAAVDMLPALEIYASRFIDPATVSDAENLADCLANAGLIVGAPAATPSPRPQGWDIDLVIDGDRGTVRDARHPVGDPLRLVAWLANHLNSVGDALRAGQVVTTGALLLAPVGREVRGEWQGLGVVTARFS